MLEALRSHWPEYSMEAALLGLFMISACIFGTLLFNADSPILRRFPCQAVRRAWMGIVMGVTAVVLIYSPWGQRCGAHMNPATTLTFSLRGKVAPPDAVFYVLAQFSGAVAGVALSRVLLGNWLRHPSVNHIVTQPGRFGRGVAWFAELCIALLMMLTVLLASNDSILAPYTGWLAGALVALYITFEAPLSGMSLNPARSFGSAFVARSWRAFWIYLTAPLAGMLLASVIYSAIPGREIYCAKLAHCNNQRCIFHCDFPRLQAMRQQHLAKRG